EVGDATGGGLALECGVSPVMVVGVQPGVKGGAPFGLGGVGAGGGPFVEQGAVEPRHFPVCLRPVGAVPLVGDPGCGQGITPGEGLVAGPVVGQDRLDGDPGGGEERLGAAPERGRGVLAFIGQDFAVGQAGVVVDGGVQVAVADHRVAVLAGGGGGPAGAPALGPPGDPPAAAIRDVAEVFDVHVHQLTGLLAFIPADAAAGGPVQMRQPGTAVAGQHAVHGGRGQLEGEGDPGWSPPAGDPEVDGPTLRPAAESGPGWRAAGRSGPPCQLSRAPGNGRPTGPQGGERPGTA